MHSHVFALYRATVAMTAIIIEHVNELRQMMQLAHSPLQGGAQAPPPLTPRGCNYAVLDFPVDGAMAADLLYPSCPSMPWAQS